MKRVIAALSMFWIAAPQASGQEICGTIAGYFTDVPDGFVNERGARVRKNVWRSNAHDGCTIYLSQATHRVVCFYDVGASSKNANDFFRANEIAIQACIDQLPNADAYRKSVRKNKSNGETIVSATWVAEVDEGSSTTQYRIRLAGHVKDSGDVYTSMQLAATPNY